MTQVSPVALPLESIWSQRPSPTEEPSLHLNLLILWGNEQRARPETGSAIGPGPGSAPRPARAMAEFLRKAALRPLHLTGSAASKWISLASHTPGRLGLHDCELPTDGLTDLWE